jgi:hypothetical protein
MKEILHFKTIPSSKHCSFVADCGFVTPIRLSNYDHEGIVIDIMPILDCSLDVQSECYKTFADVWHVQTGAKLEEEASSLILRQWSSADLMFVMTVDSAFAGCVAIDRKNFEPCISHLAIVPRLRGKRLSLFLMAIAENYIGTCLKFRAASLWCNIGLMPFYKNQGYVKVRTLTGGVVVMQKPLSVDGGLDALDGGDDYAQWDS